LNFQQINNTIKRLLILATSLAFISCSNLQSSESDEVEKLCDVELQRTVSQLFLAAESTVSYTGLIPAECKQKTSVLSGRVQINVAAQSAVSSSSISLQELKAGERNLQFDADSDNFIRGTYEKRFDSSFYPAWSFPWADAPSIMTLSMNVTDQSLSSALPQKVLVELIY
jgi:hypothetical protein